jgi:threonine aldolase
LDGARAFNALVARGNDIKAYGSLFDSVSICLSKGLGAPVGSVLLGSKDFIREAHRTRKVMGGGMRQAGILAAAGLLALDRYPKTLVIDHQRAQQLSAGLMRLPWVKKVLPVETNIVIFELHEANAALLCAKLKEKSVLCMPFGPDKVRFVTHADFNDDALEYTLSVLQSLSFNA